jgi:hypothetical protein
MKFLLGWDMKDFLKHGKFVWDFCLKVTEKGVNPSQTLVPGPDAAETILSNPIEEINN